MNDNELIALLDRVSYYTSLCVPGEEVSAYFIANARRDLPAIATALRERLEGRELQSQVVLEGQRFLSMTVNQIRNEVLEEAAKACDVLRGGGDAGKNLAIKIRALKSVETEQPST